MIPLSYFLIAWLVLIGIYAVMSFLSLLQLYRFGIAGPGTYTSSVVFLLVSGAVIVGSLIYFLTVDWSLALNLGGIIPAAPQIPL
ncbi:MAG: hypothetical protein ABII13_04420 [Patescibacteria group bacterium]|nr:hypothetical protein [Patescibacteria group bacterium]MBU2509280.1 hypothetical protein [Patescibacteria group bacterium]